MADPQPSPQKRVNIEFPADLNAVYANFAIISHSTNEVIIDFAQILPGMSKARVQSRILLTPYNARMLHQALGQNLAKYERNVGPISQPGGQSTNFNPQKGTLGGMQWTVGDDDEDNAPEPPPEA